MTLLIPPMVTSLYVRPQTTSKDSWNAPSRNTAMTPDLPAVDEWSAEMSRAFNLRKTAWNQWAGAETQVHQMFDETLDHVLQAFHVGLSERCGPLSQILFYCGSSRQTFPPERVFSVYGMEMFRQLVLVDWTQVGWYHRPQRPVCWQRRMVSWGWHSLTLSTHTVLWTHPTYMLWDVNVQ